MSWRPAERRGHGIVDVEGIEGMGQEPFRRGLFALAEETDGVEEGVQAWRELLQSDGERGSEKIRRGFLCLAE